MDFLLLLTSRKQAALWAITDFIAYTVDLGAVLLLAQTFGGGLVGWSVGELLFLYGFSTTAAAMRMVLFNYNTSAVSRRIGRGQLDHTLVQPQPLALSFATEGFSPFSSIGALLPGLALLVIGIAAANVHLDPAFVAKLVVCIASSMFLVLAAGFAIGAAAFWAPRGAEEISTRANQLLTLTDFPFDPLPARLRTALLTALPAGFVAWFPASVLLGRRPPDQWVFVPLVATAAALVAAAIFRKGLRHYERTGSTRYSTFGHRR